MALSKPRLLYRAYQTARTNYSLLKNLIIMRNKIIAIFAGFFLLTAPIFGQFKDFQEAQVENFDLASIMYRTNRIGIGFTNFNAYNNIVGTFPPRLLVRDGLLAHYESGTVGLFLNPADPIANNKWCGLGVGNPGAPVNINKPYGLAISDNKSVGFYNLLSETVNNVPRNNLIAGFGVDDPTNNLNPNRFIVRGYSGSNAATGKDLLVANPRGAVGINNEPFAAFSVDTRRAAQGGVLAGPTLLPNAIAIQGEQPITDNGSVISTSSAMGNQANNSLALSNIAVEGTRAQIPSFVLNPVTTGIAVNLQAVFDPNGGPVAPATIPSLIPLQNKEYAELSWQDIDYLGNTDTDCNNQLLADANKFFISFRNGRTGTVGGVVDPVNGNSFSINNKRPVMTFTANGRIGINTITPTCQIGGRLVFLDVNGWINSTNGLLVGSDRRFKKDIKPIEGAMDKIRRLQGTTYNMRTDEFPERAFGEGRQYGFIAQDLERVIPELTGVNSDGFYAVNYIALIPVLTEAIKEQDKTIVQQAEVNAAQATTITELRTEIAELRSAFNDFKAGQAANGVEGYRLEQNAPNPFSQNTVIGYAVPAGTTGARVNVYDLAGRLVKSFNIADQSGQITINAGDMSNGLYIYDLQVNGRQILERKMTVVKD